MDGSAPTPYEKDIVAWAAEQAQLIRARRFDELDIDRVADELEAVGVREQQELADRVARLVAYLLAWQAQPDYRNTGLRHAIGAQRKGIRRRLANTPGLQAVLTDPDWQALIWAGAVAQAENETEVSAFPEDCPWPLHEVLADDWLPEESDRQAIRAD